MKPLTPHVLRRLTGEALVCFLGEAPRFEATLWPGCAQGLSNEPVADLNYLVVGPGAEREERFPRAVRACLERGLPFLAIVFPDTPPEVERQAAELGLVHAVDFPFQVREDVPVAPSGSEDVAVEAATIRDAREWAHVLAAAFHMPLDATARALPETLVDDPALDVWLARRDGACVGSVTMIHQGDVTSVWAMGTLPDVQGRGVGRRLLTGAMAACRERGARRFFLGATPAGRPLYEKLGFETRCTTRVWVSGETGQA